jgi:hypothetical protein
MPPTFVWLIRQALEGGRRKPRRGDKYFFHVYIGLHRDVRPAGTVFPVAMSPLRPSLPLQRHSGHCNAIPNAVNAHGTGHHHARYFASYDLPSMAPSSQHAGGGRTCNLCTTTLEAAPVRAQDSPRRPNRSKIRQDGRQLRGTAHHASTRRKIVRHACKLLSPWPIKGGSSPPAARGTRRRTAHTCMLFAFTTILTLASISISGTWRPASSPASLVEPLCKHYGATQHSAPSTPLLDVRPRPEPG